MLKRIKTVFNTVSEVVQVFLYFYAFFAIVVWFLYLCRNSLSVALNYYFVIFENIVNKFYTANEVDWTLIIISALCIIISYILSKMTENINMLIDNINSLLIDVNNKKEIKEENDAKNQLRKDYLKYNQFVIGIKIKIQENEHQIYKSLIQLEVPKIHSEIVSEIKKHMEASTLRSFSEKDDCIILRSKSFSDIEDYIDSINNLSQIIKNRYSNNEYLPSINCYVEPLKPESLINQNFILKVLNMNLTPKFITNEKFYNIYNEFGLKKYKILTVGLYNLDGEMIELFQIK